MHVRFPKFRRLYYSFYAQRCIKNILQKVLIYRNARIHVNDKPKNNRITKTFFDEKRFEVKIYLL